MKADLVCYGKTLGGGLPVGVLCGKKENMTRADPKKAARVAYVIGTFAGHPAVMGSMNAFLKWRSWSKEAPLALRSARRGRSDASGGACKPAPCLASASSHCPLLSSDTARWHAKPETAKAYVTMHERIDEFIATSNKAFEEAGYPLKFSNWFSVWSMMFTTPGRYHWMFQYYLRDAGVALSWVGSAAGRSGPLLSAARPEQRPAGSGACGLRGYVAAKAAPSLRGRGPACAAARSPPRPDPRALRALQAPAAASSLLTGPPRTTRRCSSASSSRARR